MAVEFIVLPLPAPDVKAVQDLSAFQFKAVRFDAGGVRPATTNFSTPRPYGMRGASEPSKSSIAFEPSVPSTRPPYRARAHTARSRALLATSPDEPAAVASDRNGPIPVPSHSDVGVSRSFRDQRRQRADDAS